MAEGAQGPAAPPPGTWAVSDGGPSPWTMTTEQVLDSLFARRLSVQALAWQDASHSWVPLDRVPEFAPACASVPFRQAKQLPAEVNGFAALMPTRELLLEMGRTFRSDAVFPRLGFFLPAWIPEPSFSLVRRAQLFQLWPGWYATCILPSRILKPASPLVMCLIALNLSSAHDRHTINPTGLSVPPSLDASFTFDLEPNHWDARRIALAPDPKPGDHKLEFRSTTTGAKVAKAAAIGIATLGTVIYKPGHKGFVTSYRVLDDAGAATLIPWEEYAARALAKQFEDHAADHLSAPSGATFAKDQVLNWYRAYLAASPEVVGKIAASNAGGNTAELAKALEDVSSSFLAREYPAGTGFPPSAPS